VVATATFLHRGKNSHIVQIAIRDKEENLVSISRLTNFIQRMENSHEA
jgi:acyl-coenzyme A thioesterase PaaI-like protein